MANAQPDPTMNAGAADAGAAGAADQGAQISGDMIAISLPKELLDALIQILEAAKQKGEADMNAQGGGKQAAATDQLAGLGQEMSGSARMPMQAVPR